MIQGGMFGFPLLLIVMVLLVAYQEAREIVLLAMSLWLQYRIWRLNK